MSLMACDSNGATTFMDMDKKFEQFEHDPFNYYKSENEIQWTFIDVWKNKIDKFDTNYIEVKTRYIVTYMYVKLYFGLLETPDISTQAGQFWVSVERNPTQDQRCIAYLRTHNACNFNLLGENGVNIMFGSQKDKDSWPSILIERKYSKFFVYF